MSYLYTKEFKAIFFKQVALKYFGINKTIAHHFTVRNQWMTRKEMYNIAEICLVIKEMKKEVNDLVKIVLIKEMKEEIMKFT